MLSRLFPRLILLVWLAGLATSAHTGFSLTKVSHTARGFTRASIPTQTHAPSDHHGDGVWEAATRVATSGSSFRIRTPHIRVASLTHSDAVPTVGNARTSDLPDVVRDNSPQHSLPLLI